MFADNIRTTEYLLSHLPKAPAKIVFASSIDVYDRKASDKAITEATPIQTENPYGLSKYFCEKMVQEYCLTHSSHYSIVRIGNIYGPGEFSYSKIIGSLIKKALANETIELHGNGSIRRNLFFVDDVCRSVIELMHGTADNVTVNLVSEHNISVKEIAETVIESVGSKSKIALLPNEARDDCFLADLRLRVLPDIKETALKEGIKLTIEDFKTRL